MRIILASLLLLASVPARAGAIYTYVGNPFTAIDDSPIPVGSYDTTMRITGFIELTSPLAPNLSMTDVSSSLLSFSFTDGRSTLTSSTPNLDTMFSVATDAAGGIALWAVVLQQDLATRSGGIGRFLWTLNDPGSLGVDDRGQVVTCDPSFLLGCRSLADVASVDVPGRWTTVVPSVPEPAAVPLVAVGLAALWSVRAHAARRIVRR